MTYGCNDPLRFARQAEAEAIMKGYMMPGTGLNGCNSLFWNPYVTPCDNYALTPYTSCSPCSTPASVMAQPPMAVVPNSTNAPQGVNAAGDSFIKTTAGDQADDGKISFGQKIKSFGKGLISPITSMFKSPANFIKGALGIAVGAGLIAITGGAAAPIMVAAGVGLGGLQIAKGAAGAMSAKTDTEAQQAWENMGSGTFAVAGSIAGAKAAAKASGVNTDSMSALKATKECFKTGFSKTNLTKCWTTAKTNITGFFKGKGAGAASSSAATEATAETKPSTEVKKAIDADDASIKPKVENKDTAAETTTKSGVKPKKKTQTNSEGITPEEIEALKTDEVFVDKRTISQMKKLRSKNQKELIEIYNDPNTGTYKKMAAFRLYFDIGRNV